MEELSDHHVKKTARSLSERAVCVWLCNSALADLVDVTGEVEHLVGEAPLVRRKQASFEGKPQGSDDGCNSE